MDVFPLNPFRSTFDTHALRFPTASDFVEDVDGGQIAALGSVLRITATATEAVAIATETASLTYNGSGTFGAVNLSRLYTRPTAFECELMISNVDPSEGNTFGIALGRAQGMQPLWDTDPGAVPFIALAGEPFTGGWELRVNPGDGVNGLYLAASTLAAPVAAASGELVKLRIEWVPDAPDGAAAIRAYVNNELVMSINNDDPGYIAPAFNSTDVGGRSASIASVFAQSSLIDSDTTCFAQNFRVEQV